MSECSALNQDQSDCHAPAVPDSPGPLCRDHLAMAYAFYRDMLAAKHAAIDWTDRSIEGPADAALRALKTELRTTGLVYYIRFQNLIKIGTTINLRGRLSAIPHDDVLATEVGDRMLEQARHEEFAEYRQRKTEWFIPGTRLIQHIDALRQTGNMPSMDEVA